MRAFRPFQWVALLGMVTLLASAGPGRGVGVGPTEELRRGPERQPFSASASASASTPVPIPIPIMERAYRERTGDRTRIRRWRAVRRDSVYFVRSRISGDRFAQEVAFDGDTRRWEGHTDGMDLVAERRDGVVRLTGSAGGEPMAETLDLEGDPWFQSVSFSLERFLRMDQRRITFRTLAAREGELLRLQATRAGVEKIEIAGDPVVAQRVEIRLTGWRSRLWSASYWFRESDGLFLRYRGRNGLPGTPETEIEWLPSASPSSSQVEISSLSVGGDRSRSSGPSPQSGRPPRGETR